jgi:DNA (cytosine-5)-methyltransferase 1
LGSREGITPTPPAQHKDQITVKDAINDLPILRIGAKSDVRPYRTEAKNDYARKLRGTLSECSGHLVSQNNSLVVERYKHIREGQNWTAIPSSLMKNYTLKNERKSLHTGIYRRLLNGHPSVVITNYRKNMLIHPTQNRGLSVREAARIQSFPDTYKFCGSIGFQQQQVGNAVPPLFAKQIFERLLEHI